MPRALSAARHGEARRDERRLLDLRLHELLEVRVEAQAAEVEPRRRAAELEDAHRLRHGFRDVAAHALLERPLSREAERDLGLSHAATPFDVHSITPEPQVSPAPIPVMSTICPF